MSSLGNAIPHSPAEGERKGHRDRWVRRHRRSGAEPENLHSDKSR